MGEQAPPPYFDEVDIYDYDRSIVAHPLMDQLKGAVVAALIASRGERGSVVLDVGAGSGQMTRLLLGFPFLSVVALDKDIQSARFFGDHPELADVRFFHKDVFDLDASNDFDVVTCVGLFHHIPKAKRPAFLCKLLTVAPVAIIGDEFLAPYSDIDERRVHCKRWYEWVIAESRRRGLQCLVRLETEFMQHDLSASGADEGDFKESVAEFRSDATKAGATVTSVLRLGKWETCGGGMAVITIVR